MEVQWRIDGRVEHITLIGLEIKGLSDKGMLLVC